MKKITVELPDDVAQRPDAGRQALEALVIEGYRSGALTHHEASQLLGLSRFEFDGSSRLATLTTTRTTSRISNRTSRRFDNSR